jgi:hypothetical protein
VMLVLINFKLQKGRPKWLLPLAVVNLILILAVRIIVICGFGFAKTYGHLKSYYGFKDWAIEVKKQAGDHYVVMSEGFQNPAKYDFYTNSLKCFAYDTRYYRRTQFDLWPMEDSLQHQKVLYLTYNPVKGLTTDSIKVPAGTWYTAWINDVRTFQQVNFETPIDKITAHPGQTISFDLTVTNPYPYAINFSNTGVSHQVFLEACFSKGWDVINVQQAGTTFNQLSLKPGEQKYFTFTLNAPPTRGDFDLLFSLRTDPFPGSKNSRIITFVVK